jgi:hypothetical protein
MASPKFRITPSEPTPGKKLRATPGEHHRRVAQGQDAPWVELVD